MKSKAPTPELRGLVDRLHDGPPLGRLEMARLEELLEDDHALSYYLAVTRNEALLPDAIAHVVTAQAPVRKRLHIPWLPLAFSAAASLAFILGLVFGLGLGRRTSVTPAQVASSPAHQKIPAKITGLVGVEWHDGAAPDLLGGGSASDRIFIKTGLVELTYTNGVRMTLEGPADYHVLDEFSGRLDAGKIYATVPKGAEGFHVDYAKGRVVDLGTEFAMEVRADGSTELGVFDGEVELHRPGSLPISLFKNQALVHDAETEESLRAIPLDREKFVRNLPNRDFRWEVSSPGPQQLVIDVSHLVWKPSEYRTIFKWIEGLDRVSIRDVRLCLDGKQVSSDNHSGTTGVVEWVSENIFTLSVPPEAFRRGKWTIHATLEPMPSPAGSAQSKMPVRSQGILQFEEGLVSRASTEDFIGRWSYRFLGDHFIRNFHPDGTVSLEKNGKPYAPAFAGSRWFVENGELRVLVPKLGITESHILRDDHTLIFVSQPYENAVREGN
jgi:hypothetical protein